MFYVYDLCLVFQQPLLQTLEDDIVIRAQREEEKRQFRVCLRKQRNIHL